MNPMMKAASVGSTKIGKYFFSVFSMRLYPSFPGAFAYRKMGERKAPPFFVGDSVTAVGQLILGGPAVHEGGDNAVPAPVPAA
ncbi:MAG: hypothetical protein V8T36_10415 [Ruthenibacterium lactatiformans]